MDRGIPVGIDHDLRNPGTVAQINEEQAAVVAALVHPSHEHSFFASVGRAQRSAHMSAF
jgi:hypothetical protein